jgi:hypothetical protein
MRFLVAMALMGAVTSPGHPAFAQDGSMTVGNTIISVGGGAQLLSLPDVDFTFLSSNANGAAIHKQTNNTVDNYGGALSGSIETPFGFWGGTPVTGVFSGFFANVDNNDRRKCVSTTAANCTVEDIVDDPTSDNSATFSGFTTKADRSVDFWGADAEARFGNRPAPLPDAGGYLFRFGYVGIGTNVRGIDQDTNLKIDAPATGINPTFKYKETLDTTYWGGYLSIGGEYNILGYLGMGAGWGLRSFVSLRGGVYDANTDYNGHFTASGIGAPAPTRLGLSNDQVAFIGGATFETRKQFGPRTSLSLVSDYEWFSYAPQMKYVDADRGGCTTPSGDCAGNITRTNISDDSAFAARTMLRLNIGLGPTQLYQEPIK